MHVLSQTRNTNYAEVFFSLATPMAISQARRANNTGTLVAVMASFVIVVLVGSGSLFFLFSRKIICFFFTRKIRSLIRRQGAARERRQAVFSQSKRGMSESNKCFRHVAQERHSRARVSLKQIATWKRQGAPMKTGSEGGERGWER